MEGHEKAMSKKDQQAANGKGSNKLYTFFQNVKNMPEKWGQVHRHQDKATQAIAHKEVKNKEQTEEHMAEAKRIDKEKLRSSNKSQHVSKASLIPNMSSGEVRSRHTERKEIIERNSKKQQYTSNEMILGAVSDRPSHSGERSGEKFRKSHLSAEKTSVKAQNKSPLSNDTTRKNSRDIVQRSSKSSAHKRQESSHRYGNQSPSRTPNPKDRMDSQDKDVLKEIERRINGLQATFTDHPDNIKGHKHVEKPERHSSNKAKLEDLNYAQSSGQLEFSNKNKHKSGPMAHSTPRFPEKSLNTLKVVQADIRANSVVKAQVKNNKSNNQPGIYLKGVAPRSNIHVSRCIQQHFLKRPSLSQVLRKYRNCRDAVREFIPKLKIALLKQQTDWHREQMDNSEEEISENNPNYQMKRMILKAAELGNTEMLLDALEEAGKYNISILPDLLYWTDCLYSIQKRMIVSEILYKAILQEDRLQLEIWKGLPFLQEMGITESQLTGAIESMKKQKLKELRYHDNYRYLTESAKFTSGVFQSPSWDDSYNGKKNTNKNEAQINAYAANRAILVDQDNTDGETYHRYVEKKENDKKGNTYRSYKKDAGAPHKTILKDPEDVLKPYSLDSDEEEKLAYLFQNNANDLPDRYGASNIELHENINSQSSQQNENFQMSENGFVEECSKYTYDEAAIEEANSRVLQGLNEISGTTTLPTHELVYNISSETTGLSSESEESDAIQQNMPRITRYSKRVVRNYRTEIPPGEQSEPIHYMNLTKTSNYTKKTKNVQLDAVEKNVERRRYDARDFRDGNVFEKAPKVIA